VKDYRLACQAFALSDVRVYVPPDSLTAVQRMQVEGRELPVPVQPVVVGCDIALKAPTLADIRADARRVADALAEHGVGEVSFDLGLLRELSPRLREMGWKSRVGVRGREVVAILPSGTSLLGLAVDLGTTKVAGYLVDLETGQTLAASGAMNPQIAYGEDVMTRLAYAMQGSDKAAKLQRVIVDGLNDLVRQLYREIGREPAEIVEAVVVGNTAMHHLFLSLPVAQLGLAPYLPAVRESLDVKARDLGLAIAPGAYVHLLPNIAGFVGADHVAVLIATALGESPKTAVAIDIGTNTEITLAVAGRLITCSCASGPAFEGAHIHFGMRAAEGAIERLRLVDSRVVEYQTIGNQPPVGLCGSGILDAVAELRRVGVLDERGAMGDPFGYAQGMHPRVRRGDDGPEFVLISGEESGRGQDIVITRGDVGEIQLAKGAIQAGLGVLLETAGLSESQLDEVIVAGAFGTYIDVRSAVAIGMLPSLPLTRFSQVGNAAGTGARLVLVSAEQRAKATEVAGRVEYIELTNHPRFAERFAEAMYLRPWIRNA
jgi:uncharacterized 2Fe-2S/4Fe-4S cluster protein (DUF4445 family)